MDVTEVKEWILIVSASITMLSVAAGVWLSLREYRLKLRGERRQELSAEIEAEIHLQTLFTDLMQIANGREGYQVSEKAVEFLLATWKIEDGKLDIKTLNREAADLAIFTLPVGAASQDAAVAAIAALTMRHRMLHEAD